MSNILKGIQQALEAIRIETEKADWQLRLEILQLILSTSESVVAGARKQAATQVKQVKQTALIKNKVGEKVRRHAKASRFRQEEASRCG